VVFVQNGHIHSCSYVDMFADGSRIHVFLGQDGRQLLYLHFDESDLPKFLTKAQLILEGDDCGG
jgi:hypothetical protein